MAIADTAESGRYEHFAPLAMLSDIVGRLSNAMEHGLSTLIMRTLLLGEGALLK